MTARPATATTSKIRRLLLVALGVIVLLLAGLYLLGRQGATSSDESPPQKASVEGPDVIASSDAFDYTQSIEGEPVFRVHGDSFSTGRDARVELTGVRIEVYREGTKYAVASDRATYDPNTKEAVLTGGSRLEGDDGFRVESEKMSLVRGGQLLVAEGPVKLEQTGRFRGGSSSLEFDVQADLLRLAGPVRLESTPGAPRAMTFEADRLEYDRRGHVMTFPGAMTITRDADRLQAGSGELFLTEDERSPVLLALRGGVTGDLLQTAGDGRPRRIKVQATRFSLRFDSGPDALPQEATLEGAKGDLALVESIGAEADLIQGLASRGWVIRFADGVAREAESSDPVHFAEYRRGVEQAVRSGRSDSGRIELSAGGEMERVALKGEVSLVDPAFKAWGDSALFDVQTGRAEILGPKARIESPRGDLTAPHLVYNSANGILTAKGGVRAVLKQDPANPALGGLGWGGSGPVQVQAVEATLTDSPRGFAFREGVRAWQGKNLLLASQLRGEEAEGRLAASGKVKTVWTPEPKSPGVAPEPPLEVTAESLTYSESGKRLIYTGGVTLKQERRTLACDELVAELDGERKIQRMTGTGKVALRDPDAGREIDGSRAEYEVATGQALVSGDPVTMKDAGGAVLKGRRLLYDMKSGAAKLLGAGT